MKTRKRLFGDKGEKVAEDFLKRQGFHVLERNFSVRWGEIDIIAESLAKEIVFVEVKTRKSKTFGSAVEGISSQKVQRIIAAAYMYLEKKHWTQRNFRIDVICVQYPGPVVEYFPNAIGE
jgi:putative endonuclease